MNRREALGLSFIVTAGVLWGTIGVVSRWLTSDGLAPLTISTFRFSVASIILIAWGLQASGWRWLFALPGRDAMLMLANGAMLAVSQTAYLAAIPLAGVTVSTLIVICTAPLIVASFATLVRRERLGRSVSVALFASIAGTSLLVGLPSGADAPDLARGVFFSLVSALSYAAVVQLGHSLTRRHEPLHINAVSFTFGAVLLAAAALPSGLPGPEGAGDWLLIAYLGVFPSVAAYALFLRGMRVTSATVAGILVLLEPLVAALLAAAIFGERLGPTGMAGGMLMCAGFVLLLHRR